MARKLGINLLRLGILIGFLYTVTLIYLLLAPITEPPDTCDCTKEQTLNNADTSLEHGRHGEPVHHEEYQESQEKAKVEPEESWGPHKLAVIIPFRDRFDELVEFVPYMHKFLNQQKVRHRFIVVNQVDHLRFNRASLINTGFLYSQPECDYMAMHDVDLLPNNADLSYRYPEEGAFHVASPELHPKYHYDTFVGGILILKEEDFKKANGLSNRFWGWGREDDEFYVRMKEADIKIKRPVGIETGEDSFKHIHNSWRRQRDNKRYGKQKVDTRKRDRRTGLNTIDYNIASKTDIDVDGVHVTLLNVEFTCDYKDTPWCVLPEQYDELVKQGVISSEENA